MVRGRPLIAVVNDEVAFVRVLDALLVDEGYETLLLQAGEIAYESIKQRLPNLVILDISASQPEVSWKVVDLLSIDPTTAAIPLALCSVADQAFRDRQPKLRALGHILIEKPFTLDELIVQVRGRLGIAPLP